MIPGTVIRVVGAALIVVGFVLLVATGAVASALGAQGGALAVPGATDPTSLAYWFQLSFIRLFGTTLMGLGAILMWCRTPLAIEQQQSLLKVLTGALSAVAIMAVGQQMAIWASTAGWILAGSLLLFAVTCLMTAMKPGTRQAT